MRRKLGIGIAVVCTVAFAVPASAAVARSTPAPEVANLMHKEQAVVQALRAFHGGAGSSAWRARVNAALAAQASAQSAFEASLSAASATGEAGYKASASSLSYALLTKDPAAIKGRVVTFRAQVMQYDTNTGTHHFLADVTDQDGFWTNLVWADVSPSHAEHVCNNTIIQLWGSVAGAYSYTTENNGNNTVPEIRVKYLTVLSKGC